MPKNPFSILSIAFRVRDSPLAITKVNLVFTLKGNPYTLGVFSTSDPFNSFVLMDTHWRLNFRRPHYGKFKGLVCGWKKHKNGIQQFGGPV